MRHDLYSLVCVRHDSRMHMCMQQEKRALISSGASSSAAITPGDVARHMAWVAGERHDSFIRAT